jgi:transcriptional regulator of acetoin/glycerol metabolism
MKITIPPESRKAAVEAYTNAHGDWEKALDAAVVAALAAWPGAQFKMNGAMRTFLILPLPKGGE